MDYSKIEKGSYFILEDMYIQMSVQNTFQKTGTLGDKVHVSQKGSYFWQNMIQPAQKLIMAPTFSFVK